MVCCLLHDVQLLLLELELLLLLLPHNYVVVHVGLVRVDEVHSALVHLDLLEALGMGLGLCAESVLSKLAVTSVVLALLELLDFVRAAVGVVSICFVLDDAWNAILFVSELPSFLDHFSHIHNKIIIHAVERGSILFHLRLNLIPRLLLRLRRNSFIQMIIPIVLTSSPRAVAPWGALSSRVLFCKFVILIDLLNALWNLHRLLIILIFMITAYWSQPCPAFRSHLQIATLQYRALNPWPLSP